MGYIYGVVYTITYLLWGSLYHQPFIIISGVQLIAALDVLAYTTDVRALWLYAMGRGDDILEYMPAEWAIIDVKRYLNMQVVLQYVTGLKETKDLSKDQKSTASHFIGKFIGEFGVVYTIAYLCILSITYLCVSLWGSLYHQILAVVYTIGYLV